MTGDAVRRPKASADRAVAMRFSVFFVQMLCMFAMGILVAISAVRPRVGLAAGFKPLQTF
jgi:hypothetical protein